MTPIAELVPPIASGRSTQQRMEALERAHTIRRRRARLKLDVRAARVDVVALLLETPDWMESMRLYDLLMAMPKVGRVKANRVLRDTGISPSKTLGGLSPRQRSEIVSRLPSSYLPVLS